MKEILRVSYNMIVMAFLFFIGIALLVKINIIIGVIYFYALLHTITNVYHLGKKNGYKETINNLIYKV